MTTLPIDILRWLVILVITYTSFTMFKSATKPVGSKAM